MELTFPELPNRTFEVTYDSESSQLTIVGVDENEAEVVRASIFVGTLDSSEG
jgi:hypothetical protein